MPWRHAVSSGDRVTGRAGEMRVVANDYLAEQWFGSDPNCDGRSSGVCKALDAKAPGIIINVEFHCCCWWCGFLKREVRAIGGCLGIHRR